MLAWGLAGSSPCRGQDQEEPPAPETTEPEGPAYRSGYRLQMLASPSPLTAYRAAADLRERTSLPVRIEWHEPRYKVRVGAFVEREQAEAFRSLLRDIHGDAWTVQALVGPAERDQTRAVVESMTMEGAEKP